ncbi:hypothetical protein HC031_16185 [Planosporangium thailandense]|uniref:Uncharacterized protein n=1 Tax=Planosporangium thailandense TaxID=765197 RepID=A0ABX0Y1D5_9ACTN|nr:hypothetical protein [Planosporangium thailandense]NJC71240.1 hypothetical protein [Planosporangium thailandense]
MGAVDPPMLYVAHDDQMVIVSTLPLRIRGGRAETFRWGSVVEISPADPGEDTVGVRELRRFAVLLLVVAVLFACVRSGWWLIPALGGTVCLAASVVGGWLRREGAILAPEIDRRPDEHRVLIDDEDREAFSEAIDLGERISKTWPALHGLIDTAAAGRQLAHALWELAGLLERRQDLREVRDDLAEKDHDGLPADSPAVRELRAQREKVAAALADLDADVHRRLSDLTATALAGENFLREQEIGELIRDTDQRLAELTPHDLPGGPESGAALAEHTQAVLAAYRDLTDKYGDGS